MGETKVERNRRTRSKKKWMGVIRKDMRLCRVDNDVVSGVGWSRMERYE